MRPLKAGRKFALPPKSSSLAPHTCADVPTDDPAQVFTYIFVGELVLKLWALGPRAYAKDRFNLFDAVITTLGFVQLMIESSMDLSALRSLKAEYEETAGHSWRHRPRG